MAPIRRYIHSLLVGLLLACTPEVPRQHGPLPEHAYVWQRAWTPEVQTAVTTRGPTFQRLLLLAADVRWQGRVAQVARPDWRVQALGKQAVGVVVRVGDVPGGLDAPTGTQLTAVVEQALGRARQLGLDVAEVQIDYDCATSRLPAYTHWLQTLRPRLGKLPLRMTALPTWLDAPTWPELAHAVDGFVLQVHALSAPWQPGQPVQLCDPQAAWRAIEQAAWVQRPFRVALPTYAYEALYDGRLQLLGVVAEQAEPELGPIAHRQRLAPDPAALAALVQRLRDDRPAMLQGIAWFRLPVETDARNWPWPTLQAVRAGRTPRPEVQVETLAKESLVELVATDRGDGEGTLPDRVEVRWQGATLLASGTGEGVSLDSEPGRAVLSRENGVEAVIRPGSREFLGWLRFDRPPVALEVRR